MVRQSAPGGARKGDERMRNVKKAMLVYQAGLANVFWVESFNLADYGRDARRLLQADFRTCEVYTQGLMAAGATVRTAACNMAGDIARQLWTGTLENQPWSDKFRPVGLRADECCSQCGRLLSHIEDESLCGACSADAAAESRIDRKGEPQ